MTEAQLRKKTKAKLIELSAELGLSSGTGKFNVDASMTKAEIVAVLAAHYATENDAEQAAAPAAENSGSAPAEPRPPKFDEAALAAAVASANASTISNPFQWVIQNVARHIGGQGFKLHPKSDDGSFVLELTGPDITGTYTIMPK